MFAVIFEVQPKAEQWNDYLELAKLLRPELEQVPGFVDNERYKSLHDATRVLSLSTWADEKAVIRWRTQARHHDVQEKGRFKVFEDYHLRVGEIYADTHVPAGQHLKEQRFDTTAVGAAKVMSLSEIDPPGCDVGRISARLALPEVGQCGVVDVQSFASIYTEGKLIVLVSWRDADAAAAWQSPARIAGTGRVRHRRVRVIRDYGLADRREAPQYYPDVPRSSIVHSGTGMIEGL